MKQYLSTIVLVPNGGEYFLWNSLPDQVRNVARRFRRVTGKKLISTCHVARNQATISLGEPGADSSTHVPRGTFTREEEPAWGGLFWVVGAGTAE
jgi:hypothetical protein